MQQFSRYPGTRLSIGKRMMMVLQAIAASSRHRMQLMIGQVWQLSLGHR